MRNPGSTRLQAVATSTAPGWISRRAAWWVIVSAGGIALSGGAMTGLGFAADAVQSVDARVIAVNIPGASAISQVGTFLNVSPPKACANPIPSKFPAYIQPGAVLDPNRILVGSSSNFGTPLATGVGQEGALLSIDPIGPGVLSVPPNFAQSGDQASTLGGAVQMFSANSPHWLNSVNNHDTLPLTAQYTGVSNPLGLSNNNAFGRIWPANAPFGDTGFGSSSILDPTGLPLAGPPNAAIGGVYVGDLTDRDAVTTPSLMQVIPGALKTGAVGTALLGPSPDLSCKAVFAVVTADGAIVQEHTLKGLDGLAAAGTIWPVLGRSWDPPNGEVQPRLGVIMNPYTPMPVVRQLFVSEPFHNTIAVIDLVVVGTAPNQVFGVKPDSVRRISSLALNLPVDLAPAKIDTDDVNWASNTTLDAGSDFYVANRGDNTIVRMKQNGTLIAIRQVAVKPGPLSNARLNGIATSPDGSTIYVTFTRPGHNEYQGGILELPAFNR